MSYTLLEHCIEYTQFQGQQVEMAGRILPLALATVVGISIGVATFDRELKEQRRKRLQEEYDRYVQHSWAFPLYIHSRIY
jgi:hypothetical protein